VLWAKNQEKLHFLTFFCYFGPQKFFFGHLFIFLERSTSRELNLKKLGPYVKIPIFYKGSALSEISVTSVVSISKIAVNHNFYLILTVSISKFAYDPDLSEKYSPYSRKKIWLRRYERKTKKNGTFWHFFVILAFKKFFLATFFIFIQRSTSRELNLKKLGPYVKIPIFYKGSALSEISVTSVV